MNILVQLSLTIILELLEVFSRHSILQVCNILVDPEKLITVEFFDRGLLDLVLV